VSRAAVSRSIAAAASSAGPCVRAEPERFRFVAAYETAARTRSRLVAGEPADVRLAELRQTLGERTRTLRRSIHIRHVDTGSDGAEEWEIAALTNPYYDIQRLGLFFTAAPRHADVLLVTGGVTHAMAAPLRRAYEVMPEPKAGYRGRHRRVLRRIRRRNPARSPAASTAFCRWTSTWPGSPPSPIALLHGLLLAVGTMTEEAA